MTAATLRAVPESRFDWPAENLRYVAGEIDRLRLLARRRLLDASDPRARELKQALGRQEQRLAEQLRRLRELRQPAALDRMAQLFELGPFERRLLLLALGAEVDSQLAGLCAALQDRQRRPGVAVDVALDLLAEESDLADAIFSLQSSAPLSAAALIEVTTADDGEPTVRITPRAAGYLQGYNRLDPRFESCLEPLEDVGVSDSQNRLASALADWVRERFDDGQWPRIHLAGAPGSGRRPLAARVSAALGLEAHALRVERLPADAVETGSLVRRETTLYPLALYAEAPARPGGGHGDVSVALLDAVRAVLFTAGEGLPGSGHPTVSVEVVRPGAREQIELWSSRLGARGEAVGDLEELVELLDLGPAKIDEVARHAQARRALDQGPVTAADLAEAAADLAQRALQTQAQRLESAFVWDDLVVPPAAREQLRQIVGQVRHRHQVYSQWGFRRRTPRGRGITALFTGPSGTGKTMAAEVLANTLGLRIYRVDLARIVDKYIGETEKNLARLFDAAEQSGAVLFFDEADALFGKRTEVKDGHDRYANIEAGYLLQRIEEETGIVILATNLRASLDEAFIRRFRFVVEFPFPDSEERLGIWRRAIPAETPTADLDLEALARIELSGASIQNVALHSAFLAAGEQRSVTMDHLLRAAEDELTKDHKMVPAWLRNRPRAGDRRPSDEPEGRP